MVPSGLPEPDLTENAVEVLERRYLKKDEDGNPTEEPKDMFWRVATTIAQEDEKYGNRSTRTLAKQFYRMMAEGRWLPNSPTLTGAGRDLGMLSACFVLPISDTLTNGTDGIYDTVKNAALVWQAGGGTGYDFSRLRPRGSMVKTTTGVASGPVSFMEIYNTAVDTMKQGGHRRGAQMAILRVDHPDIEEFVEAKADTSRLTNFNISVAVTDEFIEAAAKDEEYDLRDPRDGQVVGSLNALDVLDRIVEQAHRTGEPGLFFIDRANEANPVPHLGDIAATNPCGEIPLPPYGVCNLGHVNLAAFVEDGEVDWVRLDDTIHLGVRFLDNVIDANNYPLEEIRERSDRTRRIGHGVMGWADMLIKLGIPYDSQEALDFADQVAEFVHGSAVVASEKLADERETFPAWEESTYSRPRRNSYVNTVAPTGTTSIIAGCSGGIEPIFRVAFLRNQAGTRMVDIHQDLEQYIVEDTEGWTAKDYNEYAAEAPELNEIFRTADQISPKDHIRMQAVWQSYTEQAISKTINFPKDATPDDVRDGYLLAYELGCKGITVYRDGSRPGQVLTTENEQDNSTENETIVPFERGDYMEGGTQKIDSPVGTMYVTVNQDPDGRPREVFINAGKAGGSTHAHHEALARLLSIGLQHDVPMEEMYQQLQGITSERMMGFGENRVLSGPDAVAQVLRNYVNGYVNDATGEGEIIASCPDCGSALSAEEGCEKCQACGYSRCN